MTSRPDWTTDGRDWPNRADSRFVDTGGLQWHVQVTPKRHSPTLLLLHGTGAATHSWAGMLPLLAPHFNVIAPDLPGHGFTSKLPDRDMSPAGMATALAALLVRLNARPDYCAGHSAGAAVLVQMCMDGTIAPATVFSLNGALLPLPALQMQVLSPLARLISANPLVPHLFAWHAADRRVVDRLLRNTGSEVPPASREFYARLARRSGHAAGALAMMAHWDLTSIRRSLPKLRTKLVMINGSADRTIPPANAREILQLRPDATLVTLPGLGHLAHEEAPEQVAEAILHAVAEQDQTV